MATHPNIDLLARFYEMLAGGDVSELIAEDAFAFAGGSNDLSGTHRGRDAVVRRLARYRAASPDRFEVDIHDILANDDHGMAIVRIVAERGHVSYDEHETHVFELVEGTIAGIFIYWNDPAPADAFYT